jgi:hypothetical protein
MKQKYTDLRNKTVFDFTRDEKILKEVLSESAFEEYLENPEEMVEESKVYQKLWRFVGILDYAQTTNNTELFNALKEEFTELPGYFQEPGDPWLID